MPDMDLRGIAAALLWAGVVLLLGLLLHRFRRGAWSLEDEDIPAVTATQRRLAILALVLAGLGAVFMVQALM